MVTKIVTGKNIRGVLHYNENKVATGEASLVLANGFACEIERMSFSQKLKRFEHLTSLKPSVKTNTLHISLNFDASEKLDTAKMQQIAIAYMERIGFGEQPYLVYRHNDVAHQHFHIVTTSIRRNGQPINLHNIGRELSEPARKSIEKEFGLIVAESRRHKPEPGIKPADPQKASYGHIPTKRAISNVVAAVINTYRFTSLAEYNTVLKQFNVMADRGSEETEMFRKKGLIYSLLDKQGNKVGIPLKASAFYSKPTLRTLEQRFTKNVQKRKQYRDNLISRIEKVFGKYQQISKATFGTELKNEGVHLVFLQNRQAFTYGATFIDNRNKTVFNGSDLGKAYSAKQLIERFSNVDQLKTYLKPTPIKENYLQTPEQARSYLEPVPPTNYLEGLLSKPSNEQGPGMPKRKKKKRRGTQFRL